MKTRSLCLNSSSRWQHNRILYNQIASPRGMGCRGRTEMSLVSHRSTPFLYIHKKLRIALRHERFRNAPNIRNPAPRQLLCAFACLIPHVWRSENVCKCSCEHGICSRFPRCFLHIRQEAVVLDISVSAAILITLMSLEPLPEFQNINS